MEESREEDERRGIAADSGGGVGGLFDVQMILEMRRRALESGNDSDEPEDTDQWSD